MARSVGEHIDIIIGGHSHSLLWNALDAPSKEVISGPYPVIMGSHSKPEHKVSLRNVIYDIDNLISLNQQWYWFLMSNDDWAIDIPMPKRPYAIEFHINSVS